MNSREIEQLLKYDKNFMGCFAYDNLPRFPQKFPAKIIINTGSVKTEGDHWISMIMTLKKCFYFDSFGLPVLNQDILNWLKEKYSGLIYSNICIQNYDSIMCGAFCIAFLEYVDSKKSYYEFLNSFSHVNIVENDHVMRVYLRERLLKCVKNA